MVADGSFVVVMHAAGDNRVVVERLPRGPYLFQQVFFPRGGAPHLIARGHALVPAAERLDEVAPAEFAATLERLRVLPAEYDVDGLRAQLETTPRRGGRAASWLARPELDVQPQPVTRAFVAYFVAQTPATREALMAVLSSAGLAELALELVGDAGDEVALREIAAHIDSSLAAFGLADYPQPQPTPNGGTRPAPVENFGTTQWNQWNRLKQIVWPAAAKRVRAHKAAP